MTSKTNAAKAKASTEATRIKHILYVEDVEGGDLMRSLKMAALMRRTTLIGLSTEVLRRFLDLHKLDVDAEIADLMSGDRFGAPEPKPVEPQPFTEEQLAVQRAALAKAEKAEAKKTDKPKAPAPAEQGNVPDDPFTASGITLPAQPKRARAKA